jgi:hypothetical protein
MPCSPGMALCRATCLHRERVEDYRAERQRQADVAEAVSLGYSTEWALYVQEHPLVTFQAWLRHTAGERDRQDVAA